MKRVLTILLITLLILPAVIAQAIPNEEEIPIRGVNDINQKVENDILIPNSLSYIARVVFRLEGPVYLTQFIILSCLFLLVLLFLFNIIRISDFPGGKLASFTVILLITLIGSSSGGLLIGANIYLSVLSGVQLFNEYHFLGIFFTVVLFLILIWLISLLGKYMEHKQKFQKGFEEGVELAQ